ncbi:hypothetical protein [Pseudotamlana agarivorans]|uniref:hypothetical protein n=1 Tax=Pseudotamlana agarivorans TaxID=481183 RepID=UPI00082E7BD1|nr:hypothetical protein [Tamlana agarivorans]
MNIKIIPLFILILNFTLTSCDFDYPRKNKKIDKSFILKIDESELKDFDSINRLIINNKSKLIPIIDKKNRTHEDITKRKINSLYITKRLLNEYLPDSTINRGFLERHNFSLNDESKMETKPKLNLKRLHFVFDYNRAIYVLWNSELLRGERHPEIHEKNYNYHIVQKLLYNFDLDSITIKSTNLLHTQQINENWIYVIDYEKVGDDDNFTPTKEETRMLKEKYFNF